LITIGLLGPVVLCGHAGEVPVSSPQLQLVLAVLAADLPHPVPTDMMAERLWADHPPAGARGAISVRISQLRRLLTVAAGDGPAGGWLPRYAGAYLLRIDPDAVDLVRFRRLVADAAAATRADGERLVLLDRALALWRGPALAGVPGDWAGRMRESWDLERLAAVLERARAGLRLRRYAAVLPALREAAERHPYHEGLAVLLGWALAADGRTVEAAEHCRVVSHRLRREAMIDPGQELRALHEAVLSGRPLPPLPGPPVVAAAVVVPSQLPGDVPTFAGRAAQLARLDELLAGAAAAPTAVVIAAVSGTAGVGKTTLAVHWAHQVAGRFPDGRLYVNLRGYDAGGQAVTPAAALRGMLEGLGLPPHRVPSDVDAQAALYRSLLSGKRMLVVLDNARDAAQVRPLLPGSAGVLTIVTSRDQLTDLVAADGAHPVALDLLTTAEAGELLGRRLGAARVAAEPAAVDAIIAACAGLPLALAVAAARAATHPAFTLAALAAELADAGRSSDVVTQVRAVLSWSYAALSEPAARLFRLLGVHPGPEISAASAAAVAGLTSVGPLLGELSRAGLLAETAPGRYTRHDLLTGYAVELASRSGAAERDAAVDRLLDHYTATAYAADRLVYPSREAIPDALRPAGPPAAAPADALEWLSTEHAVLLAVQRTAAASGRHAVVWQLAWALDTFLNRRGHWHDLAAAWAAALAGAAHLDHPATAYAHRRLARPDIRLRRLDAADAHLRRTLALAAAADDKVEQAHAEYAYSLLWEVRRRPDLALQHAERALDLYSATDHPSGIAHSLNNVGYCHAQLGDGAAAIPWCERALTLQRALGNRTGEAAALDSLGYAHLRLSRYAAAAARYQEAAAVYRAAGDRYEEATSLTGLGDSHLAAGALADAHAAWTAALTILTDLAHPDAAPVRAKLTAHPQTRWPGPID
jgi:DNA-binding SARP family transcriptional activator/tetratricopeptide (TPR) repeat protein